jgi:hypothetical protein
VPIGARERGAERFDCVPIWLAVSREFREAMVERGVNDAIRHGCSGAQALQVFNIASMDLSAGGNKSFRTSIRAGQSEYPMTRSYKFLNYRRTDEPGGTGHEDAHGNFPDRNDE